MILIGTSGYSFPDWAGVFYPEGLPERKRLAFYAEEFPVVEINASYYRLPTRRLFGEMRKRAPAGFLFWVKLYQGLTHEKALDPQELKTMAESVEPLEAAGQLSGLLAQFPWGFRSGEAAWERLGRLRDGLGDRPLAVEFRHRSWDRPEVYERLRQWGCTYCIVDEPRMSDLMPPVVEITSPTAYFRFHGRNREGWWSGGGTDRYDYSYSPRELQGWKGKIIQASKKARQVFVFFNNCHAGQAAKNAQTLREMLGLPLPSGRLF